MNKKECPSCAMEIDNAARECPICGYEFPHTDLWLKVMAILLILLFLYFMIF
ncbi:MAG: zinc ribbon domain-containing protein [Fulvivirga sp.]|uniref:zinc ribbon domain-containing protein n=1 Tax=Fulvivirga sp. TaxID=1931237 RepID=UPI0032EB7B29